MTRDSIHYGLYLDHYNLACSGSVDASLAQKRLRQQQRKRVGPYADISLELPPGDVSRTAPLNETMKCMFLEVFQTP